MKRWFWGAGLVLLLAASACAPVGANGWPLANGSSGMIVVSSNEGKLRAVDSQNPDTERWHFPEDTGKSVQGVHSLPPMVDGTVYVSAFDHRLYALDASTGRERWNYATNGPVIGGAATAQGRVFVPSADGHLYAVSVENGQEQWRFPKAGTVGPIWSTPAVSSDGSRVYVGSFDHKVYAINAASGDKLWEFEAGGAIAGSPTLSGDGASLYIGANDSKVYALNTADGGKRWEAAATDWVWGQPAIANSTVYAGSFDGKLYAFDQQSGQKRWDFSAGSALRAGPVVVADGMIVIGTQGGSVYCLQGNAAATAAPESRSFATNTPILAPLAVVDRTVYATGENNTVFVVDGTTCNAQRQFSAKK